MHNDNDDDALLYFSIALCLIGLAVSLMFLGAS